VDIETDEPQDQHQSAADRRRVPRRTQHLAIKCRILKGGLFSSATLGAEALDISPEGIAMRLGNRNAPLSREDVDGRHVKIEFVVPDDRRVLKVVGEVRWSKDEGEDSPGAVRVGIQFFAPEPEVVEAVSHLIKVGKGQKQFLWNLWETLSENR
jgi:hypothetical protein